MEYLVIVVLVVFVICFLGYRMKYKHERFQAPGISMYDFPFETGDLVLTDGTGILPAFTKSNVDHAGIIFKDEKTGQLFLWHALLHDAAHMTPLFRELEKYKLVYIRKLQGNRGKLKPITKEWRDKTRKNATFFTEVIFQGAQKFFWPLLYNSPSPVPQRKQYYCTVLAMKTYTEMGVFPADLQKSHTFFTEDLCSWSQRYPLTFANGFSFGPEIKLVCK
jgi:hypothetical protein